MERIRITYDVPERIKRALNICASRKGLTVGQVIEELTVEHLADDLAVADKTLAEEGKRKGKAAR